ncbi:hypothetical protein HOLleu_43264 [Holothuria leucospilota]|uniref:Uncharacterized protein n=1 Tax=Holothuria leucospilota TaxID=206669 RepID=A0A9Q1BBP9_HOLLE|nr:hypothetical protein HOLleu_43264 [Holothuria leucospilota]
MLTDDRLMVFSTSNEVSRFAEDSYIPVLWFLNKGSDIQFETDEKHLQSSGIEAIIWLSIVSDEDAYP